MDHTYSHTHTHALTQTHTHYISLHCTFAPLRITDLLSTFGSNSGDSSKLTPSKQKKSWRPITDIIGFHFNHVSGKKKKRTRHHPEEKNRAAIQSLYLLHCMEGVCLCECADEFLLSPPLVCVSSQRVGVGVCCTFRRVKSQDAFASVKWIQGRREKWVSLLLFKVIRLRGTNWRQ